MGFFDRGLPCGQVGRRGRGECGQHARAGRLSHAAAARRPACLFSESLPERILCLPMQAHLSEADQDRVIDAIRDFVSARTSHRAAGGRAVS
jgi:hypothetical protein